MMSAPTPESLAMDCGLKCYMCKEEVNYGDDYIAHLQLAHSVTQNIPFFMNNALAKIKGEVRKIADVVTLEEEESNEPKINEDTIVLDEVRCLKENLEKEAVSRDLKEQELVKLQFLFEESRTMLSGDEQEIVKMKEKSIAVEKEAELLIVESELDKVQEESKSMEEVLEGIEQKRQDLELEKQRLNEALNEVGANCDKRGEKIKEHLAKVGDLESKLDTLEKDELTHKLEILQTQMEEMENEKDEMKSQLSELRKEKMSMKKGKESIQQAMSNFTEKQLKDIEEEKLGMKSKIGNIEKLLEERNVEKLKMAEEMERLQIDKIKLKEEIETLKLEKAGIEEKIKEVDGYKEKYESRNKKLEEELKATNSSRAQLASSISQLITDTNELKEKVEFNSMEHDKEKLKFERESDELKTAIEEKEQTFVDLKKESRAKASVVSELEEELLKNYELKTNMNMIQSEVDKLKHDLASAEIKYTDLEQATQENCVTEIKEALEDQKERYEANHKQIVDCQTEKYKSMLQEFAKLKSSWKKKIEEVKKIVEEKRSLTAKCESYKAKVTDIVKKLGENEKLIDNILNDNPTQDLDTTASPGSGGGISVQCPVCLESLKSIKKSGYSMVSTVCGHIFCSRCLPASLRASGRCPSCRRRVGPTEYHEIFI